MLFGKIFRRESAGEHERPPHVLQKHGSTARVRWSGQSVLTYLSVTAAILAALASLWQARLTEKALKLTLTQMDESRRQSEAQSKQSTVEAQRQATSSAAQFKLTAEAVAAAKTNANAAWTAASLARESSAFAKNSFQTSHRAYMVLESAALVSAPRAGSPVQIRMIYKNVGQTVALRTNPSWSVFALRIGTNAKPLTTLPIPPLGNESVGPALSIRASDLKALDGNDAKAVADGDAVLIVVGMVVYDDIFGTTHLSEWCGTWTKSMEDFSLHFCSGGVFPRPRFY